MNVHKEIKQGCNSHL